MASTTPHPAYQVLHDILLDAEGQALTDIQNLVDPEDPFGQTSCENVFEWVKEQLDKMMIPEGTFRDGYLTPLYPLNIDEEWSQLYGLIEHIVLLESQPEEGTENALEANPPMLPPSPPPEEEDPSDTSDDPSDSDVPELPEWNGE